MITCVQLNALIARGESELQLFQKWDTDAVTKPEAGTSCHPLQVCVYVCTRFA